MPSDDAADATVPAMRSARTLIAALGLVLAVPLAGQAQDAGVGPGECGPRDPGVNCGPGNDRQTGGGGAKAPHNDGAGRNWPKISGILWQVVDNGGRAKLGGPDNDELLGHHGSDHLSGAGGNDILWGDWDPRNNSTRQRDYISGGSGNDWLYPSHGHNTVRGGPGTDYVYAYYGRGTIDCGPGRDTARVRIGTGQYRVRNCETIKHFCAFGENAGGGCNKPGARAAGRRTR
jgi:hypothetical protein